MNVISKSYLNVFLCHATDDKPSVRKLYERLKEDGIDVWFDEEKLLPGQDWDMEIQNAVRQSDVVIICLSKKSVTKEGYVQKEIKIALDVADEKPEGTIYLIPTRLEECNVPNRINRWQWIDLFSSGSAIDTTKYKKLFRSLELRAEQLNTNLQQTEIKAGKKFRPNEQAFMPPRAWISPTPKNIFHKSIKPEVNFDYIENQVQIQARIIEDSLASVDAPAQVVEISRGPRFIQFGVEPLFKEIGDHRVRVRIDEIISAIGDISLSLGQNVHFQAPVPGRRFIGIQIQSEKPFDVYLLDILENEDFQRHQTPLTIVLGKEITGKPVSVDISEQPNMLIVGASGSGVSTCLISILANLLLINSPDDLKLLFLDMRRVEFSLFNDIPHLLSPILIDQEVIEDAVDWLLHETEDRQRLFAKSNSRSIDEYNSKAELNKKIPRIIVSISELSDLMLSLSNNTKAAIIKIASLARITGIHLIMATQHPSADVIPGYLKSNMSTSYLTVCL